ncbi:MAG: YcxB family protein, partial [Eubacterium sp.]
MAKFIYSLTYEDYLCFESFKLKRNKTSFFSYLICLMFLVMGVYDAVVYKTFEVIILAAVMIAGVCISTFYAIKIAPKKRVKNLMALDSSYLGQSEIIIDDKAVEIKNIPQENEAGIVAVYPYSVMSAIYETEEYYYFFIGNEVRLLPKKAIPAEFSEYIKKTIGKNRNYMF